MNANEIALIRALGGKKSNLPFFGETTGTVEVLGETTVELDGGEGMLSKVLPLVVGEEYTVVCDGTEYTVTAFDADGMVGFTFADDTYGIFATPETGTIIAAPSEATSVTLSITQESTVITPLPVKYLPESVPYVESVESGFNIKWDGALTGDEETIAAGVTYVKVSDEVLSADDLNGATLTMWICDSTDGMTEFEEGSIVLGTDVPIQDGSADGLPALLVDSYLFVVQSDFSVEGISGTAGVYFAYYGEEMGYIKSLTKTAVSVTAHKLDPRCLPEDATVFYLTSPNGTKYAVTVSDSGVLSAAEVTS